MTPSIKSRAKPQPSTWEFEAIGTHWWLAIYGSITASAFASLQKQITAHIDAFDLVYSRFRSDSLISQIAEASGSYDFPVSDAGFLYFYRQLYKSTDGAVTPLIGDALVAAGYDANYSLEAKTLQIPGSWEETLELSGTTIATAKPVVLDFGAAGKGYLVDIVSDVLRAAGITEFVVDGSGDMLACGPETLRIGMEHPDDSSLAVGVVHLQNQALCGSATNRRAWGKYHHIINPHTLEPVAAIKAVWVTAESAMLADGLATALFFVAPERLQKFNFEYAIIDNNNALRRSANFAAEIF